MIKFMGYDGSEYLFPEDELQEIEGVGPTTARKFIAEGFKTVESIANADVDQITEALSCSEDTANAFIELAKKVFNKRGREGFDNIFGGEDTDAANEEKPDDYGFIKVRECERKMTDDFTSQIENDDDFQPMLDRIDELADDIEELNNKSRRSSEDDDSEEE